MPFWRLTGDYYGANSTGYVIKNGILYRDAVRDNASYGDLWNLCRRLI